MIKGEDCEYPVCNFKKTDAQRGFVGFIQYLLGLFVKGPKYVTLAEWIKEQKIIEDKAKLGITEWQRKEKIIKAKKNMVFVDVPRKKNV